MSRFRSTGSRRSHREALLEAAKVLLRESGRSEITARDLVAASGTNLASIGYHFGGKDALLDEAAQQVFDEWAEAVTTAFRHDPDATVAESLSGSLGRILDDFDALRPYFTVFVEIVARGSRAPEVRDQLAAHYGRQRERVGQMISDWLGSGFDSRDAQRLATLLMAVSDGLMLQLMIDPAGTPSSEELVAACRHAVAAGLRSSEPTSGQPAGTSDGAPRAHRPRRPQSTSHG